VEVISQLTTNGLEIVLQWTASHCGIPGNDRIDILPKEASNLPPPEDLTTHQPRVAETARKSALLILDVHKQQA
jgi:hypothetical protein